jgi:sugar-specific transcriptional regulator TrmB
MICYSTEKEIFSMGKNDYLRKWIQENLKEEKDNVEIKVIPARSTENATLSLEEMIKRAKKQLANVDSYLSPSPHDRELQRSFFVSLIKSGYDADQITIKYASSDVAAIHRYYREDKLIATIREGELQYEFLMGALAPVSPYLD